MRPSDRLASQLLVACLSASAAALRLPHGAHANQQPTAPEAAEPLWPADYWEDDPRFPEPPVKSGKEREKPWSMRRIIVHPPSKLAFCYIEKNACTQFNHLFNRLNDRDYYEDPWGPSEPRSFKLKVEDLTRENGWKWAVFLRDPLVRYLSAWGSKCVWREDYGTQCMPAGAFSYGKVVDFERGAVANSEDFEGLEENAHWAPQQSFCGGLRNATGYDFVGHLQGDVNAQVHAMLRMVGASEQHVEELFPPSGVAGHGSHLNPNVYYRNRTIAHLVKSMFAHDYDLPGL